MSTSLLSARDRSREYVAIVIPDSHLYQGVHNHCLDWESMPAQARLTALRSLLGKLSRLHAEGHEAGDTSLRNILIHKKTYEAFLISAGHLRNLNPYSLGIVEMLALLAPFRILLTDLELKDLITHYLDSEPQGRARAQKALSNRLAAARSRGRLITDHPEASLEDRLLLWMDGLGCRYF